jgi:anthranilate synthase/aminodeoxychorismate synthase-like glutamine amidotransferase
MTFKLFVLDNIDSFTYNLVQLCQRVLHQRLGVEPTLWVARNQAFTLSDLDAFAPDAIVISPGPGHPNQAGQTLPVIARYAGRKPLLGVCLGMQAMAQHYGGTVVQGVPCHGKRQVMSYDQTHPMWADMPHETNQALVVRYHSLHADYTSLQETQLQVTASLPAEEPGQLPIPMAVAARSAGAPVWGVQYHPESFLTEAGDVLIANFFRSLNLL